jgi:hypothetical protein
MERVLGFKQTAMLHFQPVLYACKRAILQFSKTEKTIDRQKFYLNTSCQYTLYSWIDNDLFYGALAIILHYVIKETNPQKEINVSVGKISSNTCQILISSAWAECKDDCEGPLSLTMLGMDITDLECMQYIMEMHGGCLQVWCHRVTHETIFEINFLCVSNDGVQ